MIQEQRLTFRLQNYWNLIRKDREFPDIRHFNPAAVEDVWPYCFRLAIGRGNRPILTYEYMGEPIAQLYGRDLTGLAVDYRMSGFPGSVIHRKLEDMIRVRAPMQDGGNFVNERGQMIKYRACILPFGSSKQDLSHIVVGLSCRIF